MSGLIDEAGGNHFRGEEAVEQARQAWQESMERRLGALRDELRERNIGHVAANCGGTLQEPGVLLPYWDREILVAWPELTANYLESKEECSTFDTAMLLYYLTCADGTPMADAWVGFRELPDGGFYHQAFQGYSGNKIADQFGEDPDRYAAASLTLGGGALPALAPYAFSFSPLPMIRLACTLWPGDEDFPSKASILFDASASHYMPTDGLALLGSGLARRLIKAAVG
jgi:hypothetical protein